MIAYGITIIDNSAYQKLTRLGADMLKINKKCLGRVGQKIVGQSQTHYLRGRPGLNRGHGTLATSLHYNFKDNDTIFVGPGVMYGAVHEGYAYGRKWAGFVTIRPRIARVLHFKIGGEDVFAKKVNIPVRPWLEPAIRDVFDQGIAERTVEATLQQELTRLERAI